jgi:hypothetical protein
LPKNHPKIINSAKAAVKVLINRPGSKNLEYGAYYKKEESLLIESGGFPSKK